MESKLDSIEQKLHDRLKILSGDIEFANKFEELIAICHETAMHKGWWNPPKTVGEQIALYHAEVSEALEEIRNGHEPHEIYFVDGKPEGFPIELGDTIIRMLDTVGFYDAELLAGIYYKMFYNLTRSHRHGGKVL